jgi:hypothetical protein
MVNLRDIPAKSFPSFKCQLKSFQEFFREHVLLSPKFKWYRRIIWTVSIVWACFLLVQSIPYYNAIGKGESAYKTGDYIEAEKQFKIALSESEHFSNIDLRRAKALNNLAELYRTEARYKELENNSEIEERSIHLVLAI